MYDYISLAKNCRTSVCSEFYLTFERLCLALKSLCTGLMVTTSKKMKMLLCQCISIASKLIPVMGVYFTIGTIIMPNVTQTRHLISTVQYLSHALVGIQKVCGEKSYAATILFWNACDALPCILDMATLSRKEFNCTPLQSEAYGRLILQSLAITCPTPHELEKEIIRLQSKNIGPDIGPEYQGQGQGQGVKPVPSPVRTDANSTVPSPVETDAGRTVPPPGHLLQSQSFSVGFVNYRLQFILDGLQRVLRAGILTMGNR